MADSDTTVEILKDIRSEIRTTNQRLDSVESTLNRRPTAVEEQLGGVQDHLGGVQDQLGSRASSVS